MSDSLQREQAIFDSALELPYAERVVYLDRVTHGDEALRDRLNELLKGYEVGTFLESSAAAVSRRTIEGSEPSAELGEKIGRYKLLQAIGEGGCGVVYMAEQEEPVRRLVALKIIKLGMDTKSVIARFEAERQALALMDHPNIAKVFDACAAKTGRPYFVMELVRGMKITEYCDQAKLPIRARLGLFIQVCQAVQHAHQKGIIHRDLKPSNILVTINDGVPVPKVIDFGIAKATGGQRLTDKTIFTAFEQFIGTPSYMSPEQVVLTSVDIDTRSDIYALGVLLYELLSGTTPFEMKELLAIGLDEMRRTIREKEPERPSTRLNTLAGGELSTMAQRRGIDAPRLLSGLRGDLDWIVMKCLEKDRARRYETANGLATDIQRHLNNEPVVARPPSNLYRLQKLMRRNKLAVVAASAVSVSLIIGLIVSTTLLVKEKAAYTRAAAAEGTAQRAIDEARRQRDEAIKQKENADGQAGIAKAVKEFLQYDLLRQADLRDQADRGFEQNPDLTVREALQRAAEKIGQRFTNQPLVEAEIRQTLGVAFDELCEPSMAVPNFERAVALYGQVLGPTDPQSLRCDLRLANAYESAGRSLQAQSLWQETLELQRAELGPEHPDTLRTMTQVARVIRWSGRQAEAISLHEKTLALQRAKLGPDHADTLESMFWLALAYHLSGRNVEAVPLLEERLKLTKAKLGPSHPSTLSAMTTLTADAYVEAGRVPEAMQLLDEALRLLKSRSAPGYVDYSRAVGIMFDLARVRRAAGLQVEAQRLLRDIVTTSLERQPQGGDQLRFRASVLARVGRWKEAASDLVKLIEYDPESSNDRIKLAAVLIETGELEQYRAQCQASAEQFRNTTERGKASEIAKACLILPASGPHLEIGTVLADSSLMDAATNNYSWPFLSSIKALSEYRRGSFASAADWSERALRAAPVLKQGHPWVEVDTYAVLAMARYRLKESDLAREALANGQQIAEAKLPKLESGDLGTEWSDVIIADQLMREAKTLMDSTSLPKDSP